MNAPMISDRAPTRAKVAPAFLAVLAALLSSDLGLFHLRKDGIDPRRCVDLGQSGPGGDKLAEIGLVVGRDFARSSTCNGIREACAAAAASPSAPDAASRHRRITSGRNNASTK